MDDCTPSGIVTQGMFLERLAEVPGIAKLKLRLLSEAEAPNWQNYQQLFPTPSPYPLIRLLESTSRQS